MQIAKINGIEICYETYGSKDDPALVLINGLGSQQIRWPEGFKQALVDQGFRVITFDNRDTGLTTKFDDATESPAYTIDDMADDVAALLDHLGIASAHIVGQSMGGMIGQVLALRHTPRVLSLASVMSATGDDAVLAPDPEVIKIFTEPAETERDKAIEQDIRHRRIMAGSGFPFDEDAMRDLSERCYDRCYLPAGRVRQMLAIQTARPRAKALAQLSTPIVVIHGTDDKLVPFSNGESMAASIPGAELVAIEGMGHDLPKGAWTQVVDAIVSNSRRAATVN
jgi:pimeloyl-ACP methyl ester carboxylesterase